MANFAKFELRQWRELVCDRRDIFLLFINNSGGTSDYAELNLRTGAMFFPPVTSFSPSSGSDDIGRRLYVSTNQTNIDVWDLDTKIQQPSLVVSPALPGASSWGAFNQDNGLLSIMVNQGGPWPVMTVNPNTGARGPIQNVTGFGGIGTGTSLAVSPDGSHYLPIVRDIGGGQEEIRIYRYTLANTNATLFASDGPHPVGSFANSGATWASNNKIYVSRVQSNDNAWSFNLDDNTFDLTGIASPFLANSMGSYTLGPETPICFWRNYKQIPDGTIVHHDTALDGTPYQITGGVACCGEEIDQ